MSAPAAPDPPARQKPVVKLSDETILARAVRRTKENPVIPIATLVALGSVLVGSRRLFARDSKGLQKSMRVRVVAQAVAFGALGVSLTYEAMKSRPAAPSEPTSTS
ncbi:hypothetical protein DFJ74DRAFT_711707 [Hyaloraphidium curvatum]|nr:hypothetical protein DFJ74DRAFT_711707 [Hyaloraphidium curvatum]